MYIYRKPKAIWPSWEYIKKNRKQGKAKRISFVDYLVSIGEKLQNEHK